MKQIIIVMALQLSAVLVWGQTDSNWNVLILKKGNKLVAKNDMAAFSNTGFYLYRNCVYEINLKREENFSGRLVDVKPDTLFFTNYFNANVAVAAGSRLDTFSVYYKDLDKLNLIGDRSFGLYAKHAFDNYDFIFTKDTTDRTFQSHWAKLYSNDSTEYEIVAHMTEQGIYDLYENNGRTYYFQGTGMIKPDQSKRDTTYDIKKNFSFTPCKVEEIRGIAAGIYTKNIKNEMFNERDSLVIHGFNLEVNPFAIFFIISMHLNGPYRDSLNIYKDSLKKDWQVKVHGVNMSLVNTINEMRINGVNLTSLATVVDEIHGVSISGANNFSYIMEGVSIAGIRNRATLAKGVQVGLFNKTNDLRGFQFGLWNTNGRRSLPFINWQFKAKRKKQVDGTGTT